MSGLFGILHKLLTVSLVPKCCGRFFVGKKLFICIILGFLEGQQNIKKKAWKPLKLCI